MLKIFLCGLMVVDMILSQFILFSMKFGHFIVQNFFREQAFSDRWTRPSTIWTDNPQPGLTVYIWDQLSTSGTNRLHMKVRNQLQPNLTIYIKSPRPLIYKSLRLVTYKGRNGLQTKVATGYIRRVATNYMRKSATRLVRFRATNCMRFDYNWSARHSPTQDKTIG